VRYPSRHLRRAQSIHNDAPVAASAAANRDFDFREHFAPGPFGAPLRASAPPNIHPQTRNTMARRRKSNVGKNRGNQRRQRHARNRSSPRWKFEIVGSNDGSPQSLSPCPKRQPQRRIQDLQCPPIPARFSISRRGPAPRHILRAVSAPRLVPSSIKLRTRSRTRCRE